MSTTVQIATDIRTFHVDIPDEQLAELRGRIAATRWPRKELVEDRSQGVQLATVQELARYWTTDYDWRKAEAKLNALPQFTTEIDGAEIHFIHVTSSHENALPLIITHGWPGSVIELLDSVGPLTDPTAHGGSAEDAFHLVLPLCLGTGFPASRSRSAGIWAGRQGHGPNSCADSATPATLPRAATWAPASPTRWAARHPKAWSASTRTCSYRR